MRNDETNGAIYAVKTAWSHEPIEDQQVRQLRRLFLNYEKSQVKDVIDDLIRDGHERPSPAQFGALLRIKTGRTILGDRVQRPGPFLSPLPPDPEFTDRMTELREMAKS